MAVKTAAVKRDRYGIAWSLVPRSTAKNSYDLLKDVIKAIRQEPKRVYMPDWVSPTYQNEPEPDKPMCGTQGCIAGWMSLLKRPQRLDENTKATLITHAATRAYNMFPEDLYHEASALFTGDETYDAANNEYEYSEELYPWPEEDGNQKEYAKGVIKNIKLFMQRNAKALKAFKL